MSSEGKPELQLEIAHILFTDVVGYSKLLTDDQHEIQQQLNAIVRDSEEVRTAEHEGKLVRLPTGDGMALVFFNSQEAPVRCAMQIAQALAAYPSLKLRMGINTGPVSRLPDVNERANVAGAGINVAQRVMDCGDAGHILLSKRAADDLAQYRLWQSWLHGLGEVEVKHGVKIDIVNFYSNGIGNPRPPAKLEQEKKKQVVARRRRWILIAAAVLVAALIPLTLSIFLRRPRQTGLASIEKSIAVLPFESLSDEKESTYFADGMQDDILTELTKVADLKVISRTSVMQYRGDAAKNLREIARVLQVAHVLEGSVRKVANRVRVNAQLIDARTDAHLWAEQYDRDLADVFAIQSELTQRIVAQLKSNLSPNEKSAIEAKPTGDLEAYDLYLRAKDLLSNLFQSNDSHVDLLKAADLLNAAVARDPKFALAYCLLVRTHLNLYWFFGYAPNDLAKADAAVQTALRLAPNLGAAHFQRANLLYRYRDYESALKELDVVAGMLPNDSSVYDMRAVIARRMGRWDQSVRDQIKALQLNPLSESNYSNLISSYEMLRNYSEAERVIARGSETIPKAMNFFQTEKAEIALHKGDVPACRAALASVPKEFAGPYMIMKAAMIEHKYSEALPLLQGELKKEFHAEISFLEAFVLRKQGDAAKAQAVLVAARAAMEKQVQERPNTANLLANLALLDAALGRKEDALRESVQAVDLLPISHDAVDGPNIALLQAEVFMIVGEHDRAIEELAQLAKITGGPSFGDLLSPRWDALRGDPRFQTIVAAAKSASR
jgi:TolB-like protein